jgi:hypothetical protein
LNEQFTWQAPFSLRDLPDLTWRTRGRREKKERRTKRKKNMESQLANEALLCSFSPLGDLGVLAVDIVRAFKCF